MKLDSSAFLADPELIDALEKRSTAISCGGDRVLFRQGDIPQGLYILDLGELTLTVTSPKGEQLISIPGPRRLIVGPAGTHRRRTLHAHGHRPRWRPPQLCHPRRIHQLHADQPASLPQDSSSPRSRGSLRPPRLVKPLGHLCGLGAHPGRCLSEQPDSPWRAADPMTPTRTSGNDWVPHPWRDSFAPRVDTTNPNRSPFIRGIWTRAGKLRRQ